MPLPRNKESLRFGSTRANFEGGSVRSAARGNIVSGQSNKHCHAQSIPGLMQTNIKTKITKNNTKLDPTKK
jgi:hypothetical protein